MLSWQYWLLLWLRLNRLRFRWGRCCWLLWCLMDVNMLLVWLGWCWVWLLNER